MKRVDPAVRAVLVARLQATQAGGESVTDEVAAAAALFGVTERTVWRWLRAAPAPGAASPPGPGSSASGPSASGSLGTGLPDVVPPLVGPPGRITDRAPGRVVVVLDAGDEVACTAELGARHDFAAGVVVCHPLPGPRADPAATSPTASPTVVITPCSPRLGNVPTR